MIANTVKIIRKMGTIEGVSNKGFYVSLLV